MTAKGKQTLVVMSANVNEGSGEAERALGSCLVHVRELWPEITQDLTGKSPIINK